MIKAILTDIEGTTTSIDFVYDVLFPYFEQNISRLLEMQANQTVAETFKAIKAKLSSTTPNQVTNDDVIAQLRSWISGDEKITELKTLQGILWEEAYVSGQIQGHIYPDVPEALNDWHKNGLSLNVYSSGSVPAQKLLFGYSEQGDMTDLFNDYFDTRIGHKREKESYSKIANALTLEPGEILFLSDIEEELDAAKSAGFEVLQLVRPGTIPSKTHKTVRDFSQIEINCV